MPQLPHTSSRTRIVRTWVVALGLASSLALAACSTQPPAAQPPQFPSAGAQLPAQTGPIAVELNKPFDVTADDGSTVIAQATFTKIELDPTCSTKYGDPVKAKGDYVAIGMDVGTTAAYTTEALGYPTAFDFSVTGADGFTTGQVYPQSDTCIADRDNAFVGPFNPSSKYRGWVLIDSPAKSGTLIFKPHFSTHISGWKVSFPS